MIKIFNSVNLSNTLEVPEDNKIFIEGYAMHFNTVNMNGEMVIPGAFDEFFEILKDKKNMPIFDVFHQQDNIIGAWTDIRQDETGLWVEGFLDLDVQYVRDNIAPLVRNGALSNLSTEMWISFDDIEQKEDHYIVKKAMLTGISLVSIGADMDTRFTIKNALEEPKDEKNISENNIAEPKSKNVLLFYI